MKENLLHYFWNIPDFTNVKIPEGANTTSTVKVNIHSLNRLKLIYNNINNFATSFKINSSRINHL